MEDVRFDIDAVPSVPHGIQFSFVEMIAILDDFDLVVVRDLRIYQGFQFVQECRRINRNRDWIDQGIAQSRRSRDAVCSNSSSADGVTFQFSKGVEGDGSDNLMSQTEGMSGVGHSVDGTEEKPAGSFASRISRGTI